MTNHSRDARAHEEFKGSCGRPGTQGRRGAILRSSANGRANHGLNCHHVLQGHRGRVLSRPQKKRHPRENPGRREARLIAVPDLGVSRTSPAGERAVALQRSSERAFLLNARNADVYDRACDPQRRLTHSRACTRESSPTAQAQARDRKPRSPWLGVMLIDEPIAAWATRTSIAEGLRKEVARGTNGDDGRDT